MQKFQPLLLNTDTSSTLKGRANSIGSKSVDFDDFSAETASTEPCTGRLFISRQRILIARVLKKGIELYTYNYSKECADRLAKQLVFLIK